MRDLNRLIYRSSLTPILAEHVSLGSLAKKKTKKFSVALSLTECLMSWGFCREGVNTIFGWIWCYYLDPPNKPIN